MTSEEQPDEAGEVGTLRQGGTPVRIARTLVRHAERAMVRASDAELIRGNFARVLADSPAALRTWVEAIERATQWVHLENYIIRDDRIGRRFRGPRPWETNPQSRRR
jgi:cardiolipin synthase